MAQMYKVFFNNNILFLSNQPVKTHTIDISYTFSNKKDLNYFLFDYCLKTKNKTIAIVHSDIDKLWRKFNKLFKIKIAGGGLVINKNDEILFIKRRGLWDLPKGHQEPNEPIDETSLREVSEECGISELKITRPLVTTYHTYFIKDKIILKPTFWFEMAYSGNAKGIPQLEEDITDIKWFKKDNLESIKSNTFPSVLDVVNDYFEYRSA